MPKPPPEIMEVTLRDGSYVIDFQFTAADTALIAGALERVGFRLIEIGHGIGLGASEAGMGQAAETDVAYMKAAAETLKRAQWGMFCIPGIAQLKHIDMAADHGMGFVRIGTNVEDAPKGRSFIEHARTRGLYVYANFMKSYASSTDAFSENVRAAADYGAQTVYVVDSAGSMLTEDIRRYVEAAWSRSDIHLGFHGHNNLGMGVANSLMAAELGVAVVDTSLQGFGRGAGNTPTEQFICALRRRGLETQMDAIEVMDVGEHYITPLIVGRGLSSIDVVSGLAQFHSSYMGVIREFASRYRIDPRRLILAVCAHDKVNAPRDLVEREARRLAEEGRRADEPLTPRFQFNRYHGTEQR